MELSKLLIGDEAIRELTIDGEALPDPNLISNIDHMTNFILMELDSWEVHSNRIEQKLHEISYQLKLAELFKDENVRLYIKSLFDIAVYYIACVQALDRLMSQLEKLSSEYLKLKIKKPKLEIDKLFHSKAQLVRDKSFIHQDSNRMSSPVDKRVAMSWMPTVSHKNDESPNCESYIFGQGKWWIKVNGIKKTSEIDICISGIKEFATKALEQIEVRKTRVVSYYFSIRHNKSQVTPTRT